MDYYRVLQVDPDAEPEVIERAYKTLCFKYHPDRLPEGRRARGTLRMQSINEAYGVIGDPARRRSYDRTRRRGGRDKDAWGRFLEVGLVGLFADRYFPRT